MNTNELSAKLRKLKKLQAKAEELEAEITAIQNEIKEEMEARGTEEMTVDVFKVRWKPVTSMRFDSTAFKRTHGDLYTQYSRPVTCRRFQVA